MSGVKDVGAWGHTRSGVIDSRWGEKKGRGGGGGGAPGTESPAEPPHLRKPVLCKKNGAKACRRLTSELGEKKGNGGGKKTSGM